MRPPRHLSAEERALWDSVAKQAKPLKAVKRKVLSPKVLSQQLPPTPDPKARAASPVAPLPQARGEGRSGSARFSPPPILYGGEGSGVGGSSAKNSSDKIRQLPSVLSKSPALAGIERRERSRLARGAREIDARIDLHGMTQARAHRALLAFLHRAQGDGARYVLVITGKGKVTAEGSERGVLRRQVPEWFALAEFRVLVVGYEEAATGHGGAGALYVRVKRG